MRSRRVCMRVGIVRSPGVCPVGTCKTIHGIHYVVCYGYNLIGSQAREGHGRKGTGGMASVVILTQACVCSFRSGGSI